MNNSIDAHQQRHRFLVMVDELRAALGYALRSEDPEPGEELAMEMSYGGFEFAVVHSLRSAPQRVLIECRFGPLPQGREQAIMLRLLNMNCALAEMETSTFSLEPETDVLVYTLALDIEHMDGNTLLSKMTETVWHGRRWLETRYMKQEGGKHGAPINPVVLA